METINQLFPWLELMNRPAFCARDGVIIALNAAAKRRMLQLGTDIRQIVTEHRNEYEQFENGKLYLTITVSGLPCQASVTRTRECDIFTIEQDPDDEHLQTLALAAQQLRIPLSNVITVTDRMLSNLDESDAEAQHQASQINHGLYQLLRIVSNMSDAGSYRGMFAANMQLVDLTSVFDEIIEKIQTVSADTQISIAYTGLNFSVFSMVNAEKLERAVYNLISNALKFSPAGSTIEVKLSKNENAVSFTVCNSTSDDTEQIQFWSRYRREPAIEDSRYGLGLGMTLVSATASAHGGTVLIDHPSPSQTRVKMTLAITKDQSDAVRSPILNIGDYAGGRDKALLELAEILTADAYDNIN